jgi:hypothetical protein
MMTTQYKNIELWTWPDSYYGAEWPDYYVFLGRNRDSDALTRSNFTQALAAIGGDTGEDDDGVSAVTVVSENHWAVGWVEWIAIHKTNATALIIADEIMERLEDYPVLDEDHFSNLEWEEAGDYWEQLPIPERVELCQRFGVSCFEGRHDYLPQDDNGSLLDYLTTS